MYLTEPPRSSHRDLGAGRLKILCLASSEENQCIHNLYWVHYSRIIQSGIKMTAWLKYVAEIP
jgi:hypothetical protein